MSTQYVLCKQCVVSNKGQDGNRPRLACFTRMSLPGGAGRGCCHIVGNFPSLVARFEFGLNALAITSPHHRVVTPSLILLPEPPEQAKLASLFFLRGLGAPPLHSSSSAPSWPSASFLGHDGAHDPGAFTGS
jgi:hypothetical protein